MQSWYLAKLPFLNTQCHLLANKVELNLIRMSKCGFGTFIPCPHTVRHLEFLFTVHVTILFNVSYIYNSSQLWCTTQSAPKKVILRKYPYGHAINKAYSNTLEGVCFALRSIYLKNTRCTAVHTAEICTSLYRCYKPSSANNTEDDCPFTSLLKALASFTKHGIWFPTHGRRKHKKEFNDEIEPP